MAGTSRKFHAVMQELRETSPWPRAVSCGITRFILSNNPGMRRNSLCRSSGKSSEIEN
jgi:hypothetical protein